MKALSEPLLLGLALVGMTAAAVAWAHSRQTREQAAAGVILLEPQPPLAPGDERRIWGVVQTETDVLATDGARLYHASKSDRTWHEVPTPESLSWSGHFVPAPPGAGEIFFHPTRSESALVIDDPKTGKTRAVSREEARELSRAWNSGLYRCDPNGRNLQVVSLEYDFAHVALSGDGTLFAVASLHEAPARRDRILRSRDSGRTWDDVTHRAMDLGVGRIHGLMPDADHPALICLLFQGMRGYVAQAQDDRFDWQSETEWSWYEKHPSANDYFETHFSFSGIENISDYYFDATLGNYFHFPFGNRTSIDAFELSVDREEYEFSKEGPKEVTVTIRFRRTDHPAAIMDLNGAVDFWGLRIEDSAGRRTTVRPLAQQRAYDGPNENYDRTRLDYESRPKLCKLELIAGKVYQRRVDLAKLYDFPRPGVYFVQVVYACPFWAGEGRVHWTGSFGGPRVQVTVR